MYSHLHPQPIERPDRSAAPLRHVTRSARVTGSVVYTTRSGRQKTVPLGPCLIEQGVNQLVDIIWGASGQHSAQFPVEELESAESKGHLVLLD